MKKVLVYYNFILLTIITVIGFFQAESFAQVISAVLFFPLVIYFGQFILPRKQRSLPLAPVSPEKEAPVTPDSEEEKKSDEQKEELEETLSIANEEIDEEKPENEEEAIEGKVLGNGFDLNRRMFLKLIGSAGITLFLFSIFTKKAEGAFFGSVPGTGTISIKDTTGAKIDPAIKQPTDGYTLAQVDDGVSNTYYGYLNRDGAWYILREDSSSNYRYTKGSSTFATNWTNRASLTYDYFDAIF